MTTYDKAILQKITKNLIKYNQIQVILLKQKVMEHAL